MYRQAEKRRYQRRTERLQYAKKTINAIDYNIILIDRNKVEEQNETKEGRIGIEIIKKQLNVYGIGTRVNLDVTIKLIWAIRRIGVSGIAKVI